MDETARCETCGATNPAGAAFCMECGAPQARTCPACGTVAPPRASFCMSCGTPLTAAAPPRPGASREAGARAAAHQEERRTVTILFADISGFTAVSERLDHETVKVLVEPWLIRLGAEVERFGGHVDKYIGDAVMAVFGAPVAHEDDAERALRAAFGMLDAIPQLNTAVEEEFGVELALRIGVNTGEVIAGRVGDSYTVLGDAVNVASRLQASAPVGGILVGDRTRRLTERAVSYRALEPLQLKGKSEMVAVWHAVSLRPSGAREGESPRAPLIGRDEELARLEALFERVARDRSPQLITVVGEAGVGKSRVLDELAGRLRDGADTKALIRHGRCIPFGQGVVYWPLAEILRAECAIGQDDAPERIRAKLTGRLRELLASDQDGREEEEHLGRRIEPLVRLLGGERGAAAPGAEQGDEGDAREAFFGAVRAVLEALAADTPLVLAWEDIHWADEGTLDLIDYLSRWLRGPILQVCLTREELMARRPAWSTVRRSASVMFLDPLDPEHARRLVESLLGASPAGGEQARALADRSGGNPLFAEAIVARLHDADTATAADLPETIHGVLAARLDALDPLERQLVSHAAVIGRTFPESALLPLAEQSSADLERTLVGLIEKDILVAGAGPASPGERELAFKHVLIRDVAYETLSKAVRARKHAEVAAFLQHRGGSRGEALVALVAEHYSRAAALAGEAHLPRPEIAELRRRALEYGEAAGDAAASLFANTEALARYEAAAALVDADEESAQRIAEKSGDVSLRLGRADRAIELWEGALEYRSGGPDAEHVAELHRKIGSALAHKGERGSAIEHHQRGINLIKDGPPSLTLVRLYEEAAWLYMQIGDNMLAIYASEKALRLAESMGETRAASRAHGIFGTVFGRIGDAAKARENLERAVELAQQSDEGEVVLALLALGHNLEQTDGDYEAAGERYQQALLLAEHIGDVPAQIELHAALAQLAFYRCEWEDVRSASDASARLAEREGLIGKLCLPNLHRGRLAWRDGDWGTSARLLVSARDLAERIGWSEVSLAALLALAATQRDNGELEQASSTLREALVVCERAGFMPQSVQVHAATALVATLAARTELAAESAARAAATAQQVHDPASAASALEATGLVAPLPRAAADLQAARDAWQALGRPLDVARCEMLRGRRMLEEEPDLGRETLAQAAALLEEIGISHLARRARDLAAGDGTRRQAAPAGTSSPPHGRVG